MVSIAESHLRYEPRIVRLSIRILFLLVGETDDCALEDFDVTGMGMLLEVRSPNRFESIELVIFSMNMLMFELNHSAIQYRVES